MHESSPSNLFLAVRAACHQLTTQAAAHAEKHIGVHGAQALALVALAELGEASVGQLAERVGLRLSAATTLVQRLERDGCVERRRSKADGRVVVLSLTDVGADLGRAARTMVGAFDAELRAGLSPEELGVVSRFLERASVAIGALDEER